MRESNQSERQFINQDISAFTNIGNCVKFKQQELGTGNIVLINRYS